LSAAGCGSDVLWSAKKSGQRDSKGGRGRHRSRGRLDPVRIQRLMWEGKPAPQREVKDRFSFAWIIHLKRTGGATVFGGTPGEKL
jgi:hypothetical protein